jgi:hypothetical protein
MQMRLGAQDASQQRALLSTPLIGSGYFSTSLFACYHSRRLTVMEFERQIRTRLQSVGGGYGPRFGITHQDEATLQYALIGKAVQQAPKIFLFLFFHGETLLHGARQALAGIANLADLLLDLQLERTRL